LSYTPREPAMDSGSFPARSEDRPGQDGIAALPQDIKLFVHTLPIRRTAGVRAGTQSYLTILATTPAPTVRPPSRMANRRPSSMAIGAISETSMEMLSPGMTISVPSGSLMVPVTSVVRK